MRTMLLLFVFLVAVAWSNGAPAQANVSTEIAPTGKLRVGMNAANRTLVTRAADGSVSGISVDLGKFIAEKLGISYEPVVYPNPAAYTASFGKAEWDIIVTGRNASAEKIFPWSRVAEVRLQRHGHRRP